MSHSIWQAPAKINVFLHVTGRRQDGYHTLQSLFQYLDLHDTLQFNDRKDRQIVRIDKNELAQTLPKNDLIVQAAQLLQTRHSIDSGIDIHLQKNIPLGGGLGGGSSNAATVLIALNAHWKLGLDRQELLKTGLELGADVPFFIYGKSAVVSGIGEFFQPFDANESWFALIKPSVSVNTAEIFSDSALTRNSAILKIRASLRSHTGNDLEPVTRRRYKEVDATLNWLSQYGEARMSGSGATCFIACKNEAYAKEIVEARPHGYDGFVAKGINRHPHADNLSV